MQETKIAYLRNLLTPIKNYFAMVKSNKSGMTINTILLDKESDNCLRVLPDILEFVNELPPYCLGFVDEVQTCFTCDHLHNNPKQCKKCVSDNTKRTNHSDNLWKNVIVESRLINDITFATRFNNFLKDIQVSDCMSQEELDYFKAISEKLLRYQKFTATDEKEIKYLNINKNSVL